MHNQHTLVGQGRTANIYTWNTDQVVKLYEDGIPADVIEREARIARLIHAMGVPSPRFDGVIEVDGRHGLLFERIDGPTMFARTMSRPWLFARLARQLADLHAAIHAFHTHDLPSLHSRLTERIQRADRLPDPARRAALAALDRLPDGNTVCHGDFHPDNVLLGARGPVVIDWVAAFRGHPLADVARTSLLLAAGDPGTIPAPQRWLFDCLRRAFHRVYLRRYCVLRHVTQQQIAAWFLPITAARLAEFIPEEEERILARIKTLINSS